VLVEDGKYYLYGTTNKDPWRGRDGFNMFISTDLEEFDGPYTVFTPTEDFFGEHSFWAPEVHKYNGKYYMLATFFRTGFHRGTMVLKADTPYGPFLPTVNKPLTPSEWGCLDGTLWVENGKPYMIFCREWSSIPNHDGEIYTIELTPELDGTVGEPKRLFAASESGWSKPQKFSKNGDFDDYITDGPFIFRGENKLHLLWSSFTDCYAMGTATADSLFGEWQHSKTLLREGDSGHGMIFRKQDGELCLTVHTPNKTPHERPIFVKVIEKDGVLVSE
jgi:GH43 family beta-xylosidase